MLLRKFLKRSYLFLKKNVIAHEQGGSLVQVMVISGMVSVFGLAVMQTQKNMTSTKTTLEIRNANAELKSSISALLKFPDVCSENFNVAGKAQSPADLAGLNAYDQFRDLPGQTIFDANGAPVFRASTDSGANDFLYFGRTRISAIKIGHYNAALSLATLRIVTTVANTDGNRGKNRFNLGSSTHNLDIPLRIYFNNGTGAFKRCFTEEKEIVLDSANNYVATDESILHKLCTLDMGGSFVNGDCLFGENLINIARDESDPINEGGQADPNQIRSICRNFGASYDPVNKRCGKRFGGVAPCVPPLKLAGFDTEGKFICE